MRLVVLYCNMSPALPASLLPALLDLESHPPNDPTSYFSAVLDDSASSAVGSSSTNAAREVFRYAAANGLEAEDLRLALQGAGIGEAAAAMFADAWSAQRGAFVGELVQPHPLQLIDADWSFGVSASSSEHAAMGTTFVQLRLKTRNANGAAENVHMELNLARFYELLILLEEAKARADLM